MKPMLSTANSFVAEAERVAADRRTADPAWLTRARRAALEQFDQLGFPTSHDEDWRFTSVAPIAEGNFALDAVPTASNVTRTDLVPFEWNETVASTLVFVNGRYLDVASDTHGLPRGVRVESLARALTSSAAQVEAHLFAASNRHRHAFTALNTALLQDGAFVYVPDGAVIDAPIHLLFLSAGSPHPTMAHPRVLIVMGAGSHATVVESFGAVRAEGYLTNVVTEVVAGENASFHHYNVQRESLQSFHVGAMYLRAARDARIACHSISFGGSLVRNDVNVLLDGEGAECTLNGLYLSDGSRLVDNHTTIDHAQPHCASREVYKGILGGRGRAVFNGKIIVRPDAQKTDAKQTNKALLLSEDAQINTKPQLEIFANDVKCTHGAAVGQIDDDAIFYLRARGLGEQEARQMLIRAFAGEVLAQMTLPGLRSCLEDEFVRRLPEWRS